MISLLAYAADTAPAAGGKGTIGFFLPMLLVFAIFYFLLIRPQQKQQKKHREMLTSVKVGDEIITSAGIHGRVMQTEDRTVTIEIANNVRIKMEKGSITTIKNKS